MELVSGRHAHAHAHTHANLKFMHYVPFPSLFCTYPAKVLLEGCFFSFFLYPFLESPFGLYKTLKKNEGIL